MIYFISIKFVQKGHIFLLNLFLVFIQFLIERMITVSFLCTVLHLINLILPVVIQFVFFFVYYNIIFN